MDRACPQGSGVWTGPVHRGGCVDRACPQGSGQGLSRGGGGVDRVHRLWRVDRAQAEVWRVDRACPLPVACPHALTCGGVDRVCPRGVGCGQVLAMCLMLVHGTFGYVLGLSTVDRVCRNQQ